MRKSLWIILAVLLVAIAAPDAHADSFTYTYTDTVGDDFSWTTAAISAVSMQTTLPAADLTATSTSGPTAGCVTSTVILDSGGFGSTDTFFSGCSTHGIANADGFALADYSTPGTYFGVGLGTMVVTAAVAAVAAPEPSSVGLLLAGIGLLVVMRKRIGQGLPQAS
jgi:hypothetical protein